MGNNNCCYRKYSTPSSPPDTEKNPQDSTASSISDPAQENSNPQYVFKDRFIELDQPEQQKQPQFIQKEQKWDITPQQRLLLAVSYLIDGHCKGLEPIMHNASILQTIIETKKEYVFFDSQKLASMFNLVELKGPEERYDPYTESDDNNSLIDENNNNEQQQPFTSLSQSFWHQFQYFLDDDIIQEDDEYKLVVIINLKDDIKYPLAVQKKYNSQLNQYMYILHDIDKIPNIEASDLDKNILEKYNCRENSFSDLSKFNEFLDLLGKLFSEQCEDQFDYSLYLINFMSIDNKSHSNFSVLEDDDQCFDDLSQDFIQSLENQAQFLKKQQQEIINLDNKDPVKYFEEQNNKLQLSTSIENRPTQSTNFQN